MRSSRRKSWRPRSRCWWTSPQPGAPPAKAIAPHIEELANRFKGKLKVAKIDVNEEDIETAQNYGIRSMPTLLMFKGGKVVDQIIGAVPKAKLEAFVAKVV